jgi:hypothetical protein
MIEIIPFNKTVFDSFNIDTKKLTRYVYINNIELIGKLLSIELPLSNKKIALRNIFDFLTYIDTKINQEEDTLFTIPQAILISFFKRDCYTKYMKILSDLDIITKVSYKNGTFYTAPFKSKITNQPSKSCQYRIHNEYINDEDLAIIVLEDDRSKDSFTNEVEGLDKRYVDTIKKLNINIQSAIEAEIKYFKEKNLSISALRNRISRILYTKRKRFIKKGTKVDRIYHSFTNLSKVSRKHFNVPMNDVDIVNCQPLLLVALLKQNGFKSDKSYQVDCEAGCFYERFLDINETGLSEDEQRTYTKKSLYKNIFFGFNKRSKHNKRFQELYPQTWSSLENISENCESLASQLQNLESALFNNLVPKKSKHYFTLFDAIYFDNLLDRYDIEKTIKDYFKQYDIRVAIK